jgi:hypothetical protein
VHVEEIDVDALRQRILPRFLNAWPERLPLLVENAEGDRWLNEWSSWAAIPTGTSCPV